VKREQQALLMKMQLGSIKNGARSRRQNRDIEYELYAGISEIISKWSEQDMHAAVALICSTRSKSFDIFRNRLFPRDNDSVVARCFVKKNCCFEKIFMWYAFLINQYVEEINIYTSYKNRFEEKFIVGEYEEASRIIARVEEQFGNSVWGMDCRFAICEYESGLEENKAFLEKIVSSKADVWTKYIADFQSFKVEKNVNNRQYVHRIEHAFEDDTSDMAAFFKALLYPIQNLKDEDTKGVLRLSLKLPLIDIYNAFIKSCVRLVASGNDHYLQVMKRAFCSIEGINDVVFQKLKWAICGNNKQIGIAEKEVQLYTMLYART